MPTRSIRKFRRKPATPYLRSALAVGVALALAVMLLPRLPRLQAQPIGDPPVYLPLALDGEVEGAAPSQASATPAPTDTPHGTFSPTPTAPATTPSPGVPPPETPVPTSPPAPTDPPGADGPDTPPAVVVPRGIKLDEWFVDPVTVLEADIEDDTLALSVQYGGGCHDHDFWLVGSAWFMESEPPQVDMHLSHDGHNDLCRAIISRELSFDLRPLARKYAEGGSENGTLILRLRGWADGLVYDF